MPVCHRGNGSALGCRAPPDSATEGHETGEMATVGGAGTAGEREREGRGVLLLGLAPAGRQERSARTAPTRKTPRHDEGALESVVSAAGSGEPRQRVRTRRLRPRRESRGLARHRPAGLLSRPEASPASPGATPLVAEIVIGTKRAQTSPEDEHRRQDVARVVAVAGNAREEQEARRGEEEAGTSTGFGVKRSTSGGKPEPAISVTLNGK